MEPEFINLTAAMAFRPAGGRARLSEAPCKGYGFYAYLENPEKVRRRGWRMTNKYP